MTFWKEETLEQQRKHLQATTRWQAQTTRMQPHFTNLAWWSFNQLAKPTQTHLLEFEVNVCTNLNPHCHIKDWKTFWQETTPTSRKPKEVLVKLESLRATNSCHDGCMFTRINKFLKDLHVDWRVDFAGIWLLEILGRWFPADKSFLMVADSGQSELASSRSGLDWIEAVFRSRSLDDLRFHVHTLVWGIPTQSQRGSPRRIQDERLTGGDRSKFRNLCPYPMHPISRLQALGIWLQ